MSKISIKEVQEALKDYKFRSSLPIELRDDIRKYEQNPNCPCNLKVYRNVIKYAAKELKNYFPNQEIIEEKELPLLQENDFIVINCHMNELEGKLRDLGPGRLQVAIGRYEDQVTVIVNYLT